MCGADGPMSADPPRATRRSPLAAALTDAREQSERRNQPFCRLFTSLAATVIAVSSSRFILAMKLMLMSLGQAASHSLWLEQWPKPSASICATILRTRSTRSGWPCGKSARCEIFAAVKSAAEALGHDATHAPQPMHAAASNARSESGFGMGSEFASGAAPARTET